MAWDVLSLQKDFLGALPLGFEGVKRMAVEKLKTKEINSVVDVPVQLYVCINTGCKLGCLSIFKLSSALKGLYTKSLIELTKF